MTYKQGRPLGEASREAPALSLAPKGPRAYAVKTRSQAVARLASRPYCLTAGYLVISDCC